MNRSPSKPIIAAGFALTLLATSCTSASKQTTAPARTLAPKQAEILFSANPGDTTETRYHSNARSRRFSDTQLTKDRTEIVDFTVQTKVISATKDLITSALTTTAKDGTVDLHDLAFPELKETVEMQIRPNGEVVKAGKFPPQSIFYVPSLPIPKAPVQIGDTWPLEHTWYSANENIPLKLAVVGILKNIVPCENSHCADVEVSGSVQLAILPTSGHTRFDSKVWGRVLFSLRRGDVIWSEMRSREEMVIDSERTLVESCMISEMKLPKRAPSTLHCDPKEQPVARVPSL